MLRYKSHGAVERDGGWNWLIEAVKELLEQLMNINKIH